MTVDDDYRGVVARLRGWGFTVREYSGCYGRSNGTGWAAGRPDGHGNHHYVCALNPDQQYIDSLISSLAGGSVVNWFADMNGVAYLLGTGPMNHFGTGNSSVLAKTRADLPPAGNASSSGDMSGNQTYSGTECQHPGDDTPWPNQLLAVMVAINAAEFLQWGYSHNRAINHSEWTNRKIDMSWLYSNNGETLRRDVQTRMTGGSPPSTEWDVMATKEEIEAVVRDQLMWALPRALNALLDGKTNAAFPTGSSIALDGMGLWGRMQRGVDASRTGNPNSAFPVPGEPRD